MLDLFQKLGHKTLGRFAALGRSAYMLFSALAHVPNFKKALRCLFASFIWWVRSRCLLLWYRACLSVWYSHCKATPY